MFFFLWALCCSVFFLNSQLFVVLSMVPETVLTTTSHTSATFLSSFSLLRTTHQLPYLSFFTFTGLFWCSFFYAEFSPLRNYKGVDDEAKFILLSRTRQAEKGIYVYFRSICASFQTIALQSLLSVSAYMVMRIGKSLIEKVSARRNTLDMQRKYKWRRKAEKSLLITSSSSSFLGLNAWSSQR